MASRLSLGTRIRCQSLRLRRPFGLWRLTACTAKRAAHHAKKAQMCAARIWASGQSTVCFIPIKQMTIDIL